MTRPIAFALIAGLAAPTAMSCSLPPPEPAPPGCAMVRLAEGYVCIDDPSAPRGFRIEARGPGAVSEPAVVVAGPKG